MNAFEPEKKIREVVDACSDCDCCRPVMDISCLFFPELYRLIDIENDTCVRITGAELRNLVDFCNYCALCPCRNIRADIIESKSQYIERDGLKAGVKLLENVEMAGSICGAFPFIANHVLTSHAGGRIARNLLGVHRDRIFPTVPEKNFDRKLKNNEINLQVKKTSGRKIAYFVGCTGRFYFPDVPESAVQLLIMSGADIHIPPQKCCGMPSMLEGDREMTLKNAARNINTLNELVENGYHIICTCPTCGYMLKKLYLEGAYYSEKYQESVNADSSFLKIPSGEEDNTGDGFVYLNSMIYRKILTDSGYFSSIDPLKRISVAENTSDMGEYLLKQDNDGFRFNTGRFSKKIVYFPPCHLREQKIGFPYLDFFKRIPGADVEVIKSILYCCGISGIMGYKKDMFRSSLKLGSRLINEINIMNPDFLVTDCLSCRLQFNQMTEYTVLHPVEVISDSVKK